MSGENKKDVFFPIELEPFKNYIDVPIELIGDDRWRQLAEVNFGETDQKRRDGIEALKSLVQKTTLKLQLTDHENVSDEEKEHETYKFWLKVLRSGGMDVDIAFTVLNNYVSMMESHRQYFDKSCPPKRIDPVYKFQIHTMLERRDHHGRRVYIYRPGLWDPDKVTFDDIFCAGYCLTELVAMETKTQIAGVTCIADAAGFGFKQLRSFTIDHARSASHFIQDSFPIWFREIHVIHAPRLFHLAFALVKPFLNERVKNSIFFHTDVESLHKNVPKEILPRELGGHQGPFDNSACAEAVMTLEKHFDRLKQTVSLNSSKK